MSTRRNALLLVLTVCCALVACGDPESERGSGPGGASIRGHVADASDEQMGLASAAVAERLEVLGVEGAEVKVVEDQFHVYAEGADESLLREALHGSAKLEFRPVIASVDAIAGAEPTPSQPVEADAEAILATEEGELYRLGPAAVTGEAVESATPGMQGTEWVINIVLKPGTDGIDLFNQVALRCFTGDVTCPATELDRGQLAIVWNDVVLSAPTIQMPNFERDQIAITGGYDERSATVLAAKIASSSRPVELRVLD
jgi:SecD/SecF fusion protein